MITSSCIHVVANSFLVLFNGWVISHCLYKPHLYSFHSSVDGHLGCVHVLPVANRAAMNIGFCLYSFQAMFFFSSGYLPRSGIARLRGSSMPFLKNLHTVLQSDFTNFDIMFLTVQCWFSGLDN